MLSDCESVLFFDTFQYWDIDGWMKHQRDSKKLIKLSLNVSYPTAKVGPSESASMRSLLLLACLLFNWRYIFWLIISYKIFLKFNPFHRVDSYPVPAVFTAKFFPWSFQYWLPQWAQMAKESHPCWQCSTRDIPGAEFKQKKVTWNRLLHPKSAESLFTLLCWLSDCKIITFQ